jgi:hypothetical protein
MGDNYIISARKRTGDALIAERGPIKFLKVPDVLDSYDARQAVSSAKDCRRGAGARGWRRESEFDRSAGRCAYFCAWLQQ